MLCRFMGRMTNVGRWIRVGRRGQLCTRAHAERALTAVLLALAIALRSASQQAPPEFAADLVDRPISAIHLNGLRRVAQQAVLNNIRVAVGQPFDAEAVRADVSRLNRLGEFKYVTGSAQLLNDGSVAVSYDFVEQTIIHEVQVVGNKLISDQDLLAVVRLVPRGPRDDFLIQTAKRRIQELYRDRGHYLTTVSIDETNLEQSGVLIFRVVEGPRVKVKAIEFEGHESFRTEQLWREIDTRTAFPLLRKGQLDEELLAADVASLDRFYRERGFLDVRVDRRIDLSPDSTEAKVTFVIAEGPQYTLRSVRTVRIDGTPTRVLAPLQIAAMLELEPGDVFRSDLLRKSTQAVEDAYGLLGHLDVRVNTVIVRLPDRPQVDLELEIDEGQRFLVDQVLINGNFLTKDKVIRRELPPGLSPGRPFDGTQIAEAEARLLRTRLFNDARLTLQPEDPADPGYRDLLVEVKERNTGAVNFGIAVGSDSGAFGEFSLRQDNFDITDTPDSLHELITGRAFRGGGQRFNMVLRPGTDLFHYSASWTEPHLFDSDYALTLAFHLRERFYDRFDESRVGGNVRVARQFGDVWTAGVNARAERISLNDIDPSAPTELFLDEGPDTITSLGVSLTRSTITRVRRPGSGSRFEMSFDRYGALGGEFEFNSLTADYTVHFTVNEDFLGRISTVRVDSRLGYQFGGDRVPTYERFYLGGRSFRGFDFRTISPKGIRADTGEPDDDPIGGTWLAFLGAQYEVPIFEEAFTGVLFVDSGTVTDDPGFDQWRVAVGAGIRLYIEQLSEAPIAFDFAIPVVSEEDDDEQVFSFNIELPF